MVELNVYKNTNTTSAQYGKAYARVDYKEQFDVSKLAKHMAEHNTPFSEGTIRGILTDMMKCIRELTLNGNTVKVENLAIFKASVKSNPCSRYGVMRATIGSKTVKVGGQTVETGNAVKSMKFVAKSEINGNAWTSAAEIGILASGDVTAVKSLTSPLSQGDGTTYNLQGHRLPRPADKGIYIQNGKKKVGVSN